MEDIFIKSIHINKVRHLENIDIPISETERKHLILTGKNGSGKTSVLQSLKNYLWAVEENLFMNVGSVGNYLHNQNQQIRSLENQIKSHVDYINVNGNGNQSNEYQLNAWNRELYSLRIETDFLNSIQMNKKALDVLFCANGNSMVNYFLNGTIFSTFSDAKRLAVIGRPQGINPINSNQFNSIKSRLGVNIIQYMLNIQTELIYAEKESDLEKVEKINLWFKKFEDGLKDIFEDDNLKVKFNRKGYRYDIFQGDGRVIDFYTLSDGFSAFFSILSELLLRIDNLLNNTNNGVTDIQGIVLIDEIETHLHIDLQKKILPFLTNFFPKIQFIVTTHSPFVLNSIKNAVIFDLEKKVLVEDMTGYSINSIVESYFDSDNYSTVVKEKMERYENLSVKEDLTEEEEEELFDLKEYFEDLPKMFSPELALKINQIQLANLSVK
jgi:predicted ATP-binding protein involved in virulence